MVEGFSKMYILSVFGHFFANIFTGFYWINWILQKKIYNFANLQIILQILKVEHIRAFQ